MDLNHLREARQAFDIVSYGESFGGGHINDTYYAKKNGRLCVLQRMNKNVFHNPIGVMENIFSVTDHLRKKLEEAGKDPARGTLQFIRTTDGAPFFEDSKGNSYRLYYYIDDSITFDSVSDPKQFYEAARTFGRFQNMLADFPSEQLYETIERFHDTPNRVAQLQAAIASNPCGRLAKCGAEVEYALSQAGEMHVVVDALKAGSIPYRVTHNDTKLNNVLLDKDTLEGICVIDLDTIMPGSLLYDFGDALRFGANTAVEDETDLDKVTFDLKLFEAYTKGYAEELKHTITKEEKELLAFSAKLLTYECGIRFLADFMNGDTYFKTKYANHNLDRARNQLKLCREIDAKRAEMERIVAENF
ncbi:MAG: aminoglycoside phosphotransferase family protein [Clostridia bacterium]|nr:aminoglycoside phosphotransferase family protein [Clostridia bacterium]